MGKGPIVPQPQAGATPGCLPTVGPGEVFSLDPNTILPLGMESK
jgi:hypothetical protein